MPHTIYAFLNSREPGWHHVMALGSDGPVVATHISSNADYAKLDIGVAPSTAKHDQYDARYGAGNWTLVWVDGDPEEHPGCKVALDIAQRAFEAQAEREASDAAH